MSLAKQMVFLHIDVWGRGRRVGVTFRDNESRSSQRWKNQLIERLLFVYWSFVIPHSFFLYYLTIVHLLYLILISGFLDKRMKI